MFQHVLLIFAVIGAVAYVGRLGYHSFKAKNSCATGCSKCAETNTHKA